MGRYLSGQEGQKYFKEEIKLILYDILGTFIPSHPKKSIYSWLLARRYCKILHYLLQHTHWPELLVVCVKELYEHIRAMYH